MADGSRGEQIAKRYLESKGYVFRTQNYRSKLGEIDLVFQDGDLLVFVEVKTRKNASYGAPREFVGNQKQMRIIRTAEIFCRQYGLSLQPRFDVVEVYLEERRICHIENAFP